MLRHRIRKKQVKEPPDDTLNNDKIEKFRTGANEAAQLSRRVYLTFLLFSIYVAILVFSTTHEQLFRGTAAQIPIIDVELPIVGIYLITPLMYLLFHLNLLIQFYLLSRKLYAFDDAVKTLPQKEEKKERALVYPFPFSHMLVGKQHRRIVQFLLKIMVISTVIVLPIVILLAVQIRFLPYHNELITWIHRITVLLDLLMLWLIWPLIIDFKAQWRDVCNINYQNIKNQCLKIINLLIWWVFILTIAVGVSCTIVYTSLFALVIPDERVEIEIFKISEHSIDNLESKKMSDYSASFTCR